jgi:hypothetical protein
MDFDVRFSRHARRRMQLYHIHEDDVKETINAALNGRELTSSRLEIIDQKPSKKYSYPLRIVISIQPDEVLVITTYPLKRGIQR